MQPSPVAGTAPEPATAEEAMLTATVRVGKRLRQRLPGDEFDFSSMALLKTLATQGPMRLSALAFVLHLDASTVSRQVRTLQDRGLVERTDDPDDGRASQIGISPHGLRALEDGGRRRRALIGHVMADWAESDRETLRVLLHRLSVDFTNEELPS
ncbi:MAG: MarR family winged helix-turn-helix transcriptional regulator [Nocardioides sp.]